MDGLLQQGRALTPFERVPVTAQAAGGGRDIQKSAGSRA